MAPAASKLATIPFSCYEVGHTWTPSCSRATYDLSSSAFKEGFKIYTYCYVLSLIASKRYPRTQKDVLKAFKDILRSSVFLGCNGTFVAFFCLIRKLTGGFNFFSAGYLPSFLAAYLAILIEKQHRRPLLALYVTNIASETVFRMLRARNLVQNIKNFDLFIFVLSAVTMLYQMKKGNKRNDFVENIFSKVIGAEEFTISEARTSDNSEIRNQLNLDWRNGPSARQVTPGGPIQGVGGGLTIGADESAQRRGRARDQSYRARFVRFVFWFYKSVEDIACHLERLVTAVYEGQVHENCPHKEPCFDYWTQGFWSRFVSGFGIQAALQLYLYIQRLFSRRSGKIERLRMSSSVDNSVLYKCLRSGLGLSSICLAFRLLSCSFRWLKGTDEPVNAIPSAIMATSLGFLLLRPPATIGLYVFFKAAETVIADSHRRNNWKIIRWLDSVYGGGWCLLYALSTAMLFHTGIMEPQNLKPSYYDFLARVTGGKLYEINRHLLTVYGTHSNTTMKNFWPKFDQRYITEHMKTLNKMRDATGRGNEFIKELTLKFM